VTVDELLKRTAQRLSAPELLSENPLTEARELLAHAFGIIPRNLEPGATVDMHVHDDFLRLLARRLGDEPTGYIVGAVELMGLRFRVDRRGFIPRLDLPVLIQAGLDGVPADATGFALDLACGMGAAGICVAHARPGMHVDLADVSAEAIELARENGDLLVPGRYAAVAGDLFDPLPRGRKYTVITANPPWVPDGTVLPSEVIDHEPVVSFFGGPDGLDIVRRIIAELPQWLAPGAIYAQECDPSQIDKVIALLAAQGLQRTRAHEDGEGALRVVSARMP
jgi:release factor glutamine methyltransferase